MSEIHRIKCGNVNCYIIENGTTGILVDTGKAEFIDKVIALCKSYHVKLIVLTHAHFDHAENAAKIQMAREMIHGNEPLEKITRYSGLPRETVLELQKEELQMAT